MQTTIGMIRIVRAPTADITTATTVIGICPVGVEFAVDNKIESS